MKKSNVVVKKSGSKVTPLKIINKDKKIERGTTDYGAGHCQGGGGW